MANGIYAAAAGMAAQETQLNAISNDLANVDTTGYKSERIGFADLLSTSEDGIPVGGGAAAINLGPSLAQGTLAASTNPLAIGINGPGFLQVGNGGGSVGLTRDGDLQIDASNSLVTSTGQQMVPPIKIPANTQPSGVTISTDGTVSVRGKTVGQLKLVDVPAANGLQAVGSNTYLATAASGPATPITGSTIVQGQLEGSNVDVAETMTSMLNTQNNYSMLSRVLTTQDQLLQMANQLRQ